MGLQRKRLTLAVCAKALPLKCAAVLSHVQTELPGFWFVPCALSLSLGTTERSPNPILLPPTLQMLISTDQIPLSLLFSWQTAPGLSAFLHWEVLRAPTSSAGLCLHRTQELSAGPSAAAVSSAEQRGWQCTPGSCWPPAHTAGSWSALWPPGAPEDSSVMGTPLLDVGSKLPQVLAVQLEEMHAPLLSVRLSCCFPFEPRQPEA